VGVNYFIGKKSHHGEEERLLYLLTFYLFIYLRKVDTMTGDCLCDKISQSMGRFLLYLIRTLYQSLLFFILFYFNFFFIGLSSLVTRISNNAPVDEWLHHAMPTIYHRLLAWPVPWAGVVVLAALFYNLFFKYIKIIYFLKNYFWYYYIKNNIKICKN